MVPTNESRKGLKTVRIFYGWWIVAAGMAIQTVTGLVFAYGFSAFFIPWRNDFGWSRANLGGVLGLARLEGGIIGPFAGWLIDKYGPRLMMVVGLGMMGLGFIALSRVNSIIMLYVVFLGLLSAGSGFGGRALPVAFANWFIRRRGLVIGLLQTAVGIGGSFVFVLALVIRTYGWRNAAIMAGILIWVVGIPLAFVVKHKPEQMGLLPDGNRPSTDADDPRSLKDRQATTQGTSSSSVGVVDGSSGTSPSKPRFFWGRDPRPEMDLTLWQAMRTPAFWLMALTSALWVAMPSIVTAHIAPFLAEELKMEYVAALAALSFFAVISLPARTGVGFIADYVNVRLLASLVLLSMGVGMFFFSEVRSAALAPMYITFFAIPYGGMLPLTAVLQGYFFGRKYFGTIGGALQFVQLPASVAAPYWVGYVADVLPSGYRVAFKIIAVLLVLASGSILLARRPRPPLPADRVPILIGLISRR
ncbi:MAG: MFS transporter [Chloroflexi bacterium]|nr:MFS transporter [Chloroflexota bacterium]